MKLFIPELGTKLKLTKSWTFKLYSESRNDSLLVALGKEKVDRWIRDEDGYHQRNPEWMRGTTVSLPRGTELTVDRIYIRRGNKEYSSVTFVIKKMPIKGAKFGKCVRFWAKLTDINTINCTVVKDD